MDSYVQTYTLVGDRRTTTVRLVWFFGLALGLTFLLNNLIVLGEDQGLVGDARSPTRGSSSVRPWLPGSS